VGTINRDSDSSRVHQLSHRGSCKSVEQRVSCPRRASPRIPVASCPEKLCDWPAPPFWPSWPAAPRRLATGGVYASRYPPYLVHVSIMESTWANRTHHPTHVSGEVQFCVAHNRTAPRQLAGLSECAVSQPIQVRSDLFQAVLQVCSPFSS
jgi:hypothetical protein